MNSYDKPSPLQEQANREAMEHFAEHLKQFKANCEAVHILGHNLETTAQGAVQSSGRSIQTDDGTVWQHGVDLTNLTCVCHRNTLSGFEFAIVERLPLKSRELKDVLNSGHNVGEVLRSFVRDQRQILRIWKDDVTAQVREYLAEKYTDHDISIVVESFEIKLVRAMSHRPAIVQTQRHGIKI